MAKSRFEYVKAYELADNLLPNTFLVVRVDGHAFHKFSDSHNFTKPNDERALLLMDRAAQSVMEQMPDVIMAFGESDEYSFLIRRASVMYKRRESKILSLLVSLFTSSYVYHWTDYFPSTNDKLQYPPTFDGRIVQYPTEKEVRDYFSWRQADTHINNLYNTVFWALIQQGDQTVTEAHKTLSGTFSSDKHEMLFQRFGINYNALPARYRKGSMVIRVENKETQTDSPQVQSAGVDGESTPPEESVTADPAKERGVQIDRSAPDDEGQGSRHGTRRKKEKSKRPYDGTWGSITVIHEDVIRDAFWMERPWLLQ